MNVGPTTLASRALWWAIALVLGLGLLQYMPLLDQIDFHHEEGRRVMPAREMIASGDWISPTLLGRPYLSKPPGVYWLLGLVFELTGGVSVFAARCVSVGATLVTLVGLVWMGARCFQLRTGLFAALLLLGSTEALTKARLAEIEACLACAVFIAICAWWLGRRGSLGWCWLSGLALAAAILLKGPAALLFFVGPPLFLAWGERRPSALLSPRSWIPLGLGLLLPGIWMLAFFSQVDSSVAADHWGGQIGGQGGRTLAIFAKERVNFLFGSALACVPASLIFLLTLGTPEWKRVWGRDETRFALAAVGTGWLFFLVFPGTSVRYLYPVMPLLALVSGALLDRALSAAEWEPYGRRLDKLARLLLGVGLLGFSATVAGSFVDLGDVSIDPLGLGLGVGLLAATWVGWRKGRNARWVTGFFVVPLIFGQLLITQVDPPKAERHRRAVHAARIDEELGAGEVLHVCTWSNFNTLLYVEHELRLEGDWRDLKAGQVALVTARQRDALGLELVAGADFEDLVDLRIRSSELNLLRMRRDAANPKADGL